MYLACTSAYLRYSIRFPVVISFSRKPVDALRVREGSSSCVHIVRQLFWLYLSECISGPSHLGHFSTVMYSCNFDPSVNIDSSYRVNQFYFNNTAGAWGVRSAFLTLSVALTSKCVAKCARDTGPCRKTFTLVCQIMVWG